MRSPPINAAERPTSLVCGGRSRAARSDSGWSVAVRTISGQACLRLPGAAGAGVPAAQHRCAAVEHHPVQSAEQPKRHRLALRSTLLVGQDGREDAAAFDVSCHELK